LDSTDRRILQELVANCRITYQELGTKLGMTANAAKSRVQRLIDEGVIEEFYAILSLDAIEAEPFIALVNVDKVNDEEMLIQYLGSSPMIHSVRLDSLGGWVLHGEYIKSKGLAELSSYLWSVEGVTRVDVHPMPYEPRPTLALTHLFLRVLRVLADDARAPTSEIAKQTGLTARRVRRAVQEMVKSGAVRLTARINYNAGGSTMFVVRMIWDPKETNAEQITRWFETRFPQVFWGSEVSASRPLMWVIFILDSMAQSEEIVRATKLIPAARADGTLVPYRPRTFPSLRQILLNRMFVEAGIPPVERWPTEV